MAKMTGFKVYKGTKETFISSGKAAANADAIVYITGGAGNEKNSCIFAQGTYFANINEMIKAINFVKGVKVGDASYNAAEGGGYIPFAAADNSSVSLNVENGTITVGLTEEFMASALKEEIYILPTTIAANGTLPSEEVAKLRDAVNSKVIVIKDANNQHYVITAANISGNDLALTYSRDTELYMLGVTLSSGAYIRTKRTLALANEVNNAKSAVIGLSGDASSADTIYGAKKYADEKAAEATEAANAASELAQSALDRANEVGEDVGNVDELSTENKEVVKAINEVLAAVGTGGTAAVVTVTEKGATDAYAQVYEIKQGTSTVGTINIPKELVVEAGEVVTNPSGQPAGTYIKLTLQNVAEPLYIDVAKLVDVYTAQQNATQIQLNIDASNVVSATIVAGSITSTELAANAVVTTKIADKNVTKQKLADTVQTSLEKADSAYQKPSTGIAKSDLASDVQTSLEKADTAYQKPSAGIPKSDLESELASTITTAVQEAASMNSVVDKGDDILVCGGEADTAGTVIAYVADINTIDENHRGFAEASNVKAYIDSQWEWEEL